MYRHLVFLGCTCALCLFALPITSDCRTWRVNVNGTGDAPTIQAAVDSSASGDTILVAPGVYVQGTVMIIGKDTLMVMSEQGPAETFIESRLVIYSSSYITIEGFTFENSSWSGIYAYLSEHLVLRGNVVRKAVESAVALERSTDVTISGNAIYSNGGGIHCMDLTSSVNVHGNTIAHNTSSGFSADDINYSISNNIIVYNKIGVSLTAGTFNCNDVYGNDINYALLFVPDPTGSNGNISMAPLFCGVDPASSGNYYLQRASPCAPGNNPEDPSCGLIGIYDVGCGDTSAKKTTWGEIKAILGRP